LRIPKKKNRPIGRFIPKTFSSKNPLFTVVQRVTCESGIPFSSVYPICESEIVFFVPSA
jgi:hypothetical protein